MGIYLGRREKGFRPVFLFFCLGIALSACGGSSSNTASDIAAIKSGWANFFSGTTSAKEKISLLQNGNQFSQIINLALQQPIEKTASATVSKVVLDSSSTATVTYTLNLGGKPVLQDQTGTAVKVNGKWQVGDSSFCGLLSLEGQTVPACSTQTSSSSS